MSLLFLTQMLRTVCEDVINAEARLIFNLLRIIGFVNLSIKF